jgi:hypothetical protein
LISVILTGTKVAECILEKLALASPILLLCLALLVPHVLEHRELLIADVEPFDDVLAENGARAGELELNLSEPCDLVLVQDPAKRLLAALANLVHAFAQLGKLFSPRGVDRIPAAATSATSAAAIEPAASAAIIPAASAAAIEPTTAAASSAATAAASISAATAAAVLAGLAAAWGVAIEVRTAARRATHSQLRT